MLKKFKGYSHNPYFNRWFSAIFMELHLKLSDLVTILILIDGFLQCVFHLLIVCVTKVTILILIDGFLQFNYDKKQVKINISHNPYFNRWFSAIPINYLLVLSYQSHNPYFNRWFSAIVICITENATYYKSQSLF